MLSWKLSSIFYKDLEERLPFPFEKGRQVYIFIIIGVEEQATDNVDSSGIFFVLVPVLTTYPKPTPKANSILTTVLFNNVKKLQQIC